MERQSAGFADFLFVQKKTRADLQEDLTTKDSGYFVEIPEKLFWKMYDWDTDQAAVIAVLIVTFAFSLPGSGLLFDSYQYMELPGILLFVIYNLILMWMTAAAFCRQVKKNTLS